MANPHRGEVEFTASKKVYTMAFSINAMCSMEEALGGNVVDLAAMLSDPAKMSITTLRTVFWAGLRDHHEAMSETDAGRIMNDLGLVEAANMIVKSFTLAFPEVNADGPLPPKAKAASIGKRH